MHVYWYNFSLYFILLTSFYAATCSAITAKAADLGMGEGSSSSLGAVDNFEAEIGKGVTCTVDGVLIQIGNRRCLQANNVSISPGTFDAMEYLEDIGTECIPY